VAEPQYNGYRRPSTDAAASRSDIHHMRRRGAKSFVDDLVLSRGVVLSRAELFCDLLRLSLTTRRFVRCRRTYLMRRRLKERRCEDARATAVRVLLVLCALYIRSRKCTTFQNVERFGLVLFCYKRAGNRASRLTSCPSSPLVNGCLSKCATF
jgi:hypothetical protein